MKAGPKRQVSVPALDLSHLPPSGAKRVDAFARQYLRVPRGKGARESFRLRPWLNNWSQEVLVDTVIVSDDSLAEGVAGSPSALSVLSVLLAVSVLPPSSLPHAAVVENAMAIPIAITAIRLPLPIRVIRVPRTCLARHGRAAIDTIMSRGKRARSRSQAHGREVRG